MDIREILDALSSDDKALWSEHRTAMRRSFLTAHNMTVGIATWNANDDAFADLIDIQLALLFDRAGRLNPVDPLKSLISVEKGQAIVDQIHNASVNLNKIDTATAWLQNGAGK